MNSPTALVEADKNAFRSRLLDALIESIIEDGYQNTTVADIVRRAKTSRRTFYEHFASREECFVALLTTVNTKHVRGIAGAVDRHAPWRDQVRQAVEAWIGSYEAHPELMLAWIRDMPTLGTAARALQRESMENFIAMVQAMTAGEVFRSAGVAISRRRIIMMLGGLRELTAITVESGGQVGEITEDAVLAVTAMLEPRA
ncbi:MULTISPECIES: TetR/AcrR family transcriptional regulator [unclassified Mycolicibacterium]|uniref:TetR/AcrR family transcriptional regulator n=1 Tax=unclassified Mycolicibacterium TaxID=2636767 RepID=UPI0012DE05D5|nr:MULTISPECIES: TetR/AcrR family transcriptional regulator [unclassified Mycolicibacterium]MUL83809.1 TetR/AcrR family transcriptional regulator [Mycolicibacterium sp. CBMA 329]MUL90125.1 TetR/AcrR family transcriptional regulator [Mycolicibacterium sp. CBMA 331]MUL97856.1 TetR/AcrR family transcriptional regulator [Mycolicibacterium sp. CBMA 334]MUM26994.1 TetR/AcrR family transcriptional regulator [Mycolicibacterium sp. CBMA 295]MUM39640.1 TetR/AcrR family transcriptional regulator [Mycolic